MDANKEVILPMSTEQVSVFKMIISEREHQLEKWGIQTHSNPTWFRILSEEVGEIVKSINEEKPEAEMVEEVIQTAAVCVAWLEQKVLEAN